jgi:hypothetical protein
MPANGRWDLQIFILKVCRLLSIFLAFTEHVLVSLHTYNIKNIMTVCVTLCNIYNFSIYYNLI